MIAVTGASGPFGQAVVLSLLERGVAPEDVVAVVRDRRKVEDLRERGVRVRQADYDDATSLDVALLGVERLLLVSGNEVGQRVAQHTRVVEAARTAAVRRIGYTSVLNADRSGIRLADEHKATEAVIRRSGIPFVLLRNGWYLENYTAQVASYLEQGSIVGSAGEGRVSAATREDLARAAATAMLRNVDGSEVHELGGEPAFTMAELAEELSRQSGRTVSYQNLPANQYAEVLVSVGLPQGYAEILADSDLGVARGELNTDSGDLRRLLSAAPTTMSEAVAAALEGSALPQHAPATR